MGFENRLIALSLVTIIVLTIVVVDLFNEETDTTTEYVLPISLGGPMVATYQTCSSFPQAAFMSMPGKDTVQYAFRAVSAAAAGRSLEPSFPLQLIFSRHATARAAADPKTQKNKTIKIKIRFGKVWISKEIPS